MALSISSRGKIRFAIISFLDARTLSMQHQPRISLFCVSLIAAANPKFAEGEISSGAVQTAQELIKFKSNENEKRTVDMNSSQAI